LTESESESESEPAERRGVRKWLSELSTTVKAVGGVAGAIAAVVGLLFLFFPDLRPSGTSDEGSATSDESSGKSGDGGSADPSNESGQAGAQNSANSGSASEDKQAVCHVPPGNPDNAHTIVISVNAVQTHLDHGDSLGACPEEPGPPDDQYEEKVLICHIPPGNPENAHTISVSVNAVPAHLAHGDTEGPCPVDGNED